MKKLTKKKTEATKAKKNTKKRPARGSILLSKSGARRKSKDSQKSKSKNQLKRISASRAQVPVQLSDEKIGLLGGAFNPVHTGHLNSALMVKEVFKLQRVIIIPSFSSPHKDVSGAAAAERLRMVELAIEPYKPELQVDDLEVRRQGVSYTVETLRTFNETHKAENIYFIMGADAFLEFPTWKNFGELLELANFIITTRSGITFSFSELDLPSGLEKFIKKNNGDKIFLTTGKTISFAQLKDVDISATQVRKKLRSNHNVATVLPQSVLDYIKEKGLYQRTSPLVKDYREFILYCARKASDKKALAIKIYDMVARNAFADYTLVCSATSSKHASSIAQGILDAAREDFGLNPISLEGMASGRWVLIDFGAVVIHVFEDAVRAQYSFDALFKDCNQVQVEIGEQSTPSPSFGRTGESSGKPTALS